MNTPVPGILIRKAAKDHLLLNVPISKGTGIGVSIFSNQYNPKYFKDPLVFRLNDGSLNARIYPTMPSSGFQEDPETASASI